jgi:hypothetical protein
MNNNIIETLTRIEAKLDAVIAALHEYDNDGYGESSFEAFMDDEEAANKRMDIIGQNGNEGSHYVTNEEADEDAATFNDYGMRVVKDNNNTQDKHTGGNKKKYKGKRKFTQDLIPKNK